MLAFVFFTTTVLVFFTTSVLAHVKLYYAPNNMPIRNAPSSTADGTWSTSPGGCGDPSKAFAANGVTTLGAGSSITMYYNYGVGNGAHASSGNLWRILLVDLSVAQQSALVSTSLTPPAGLTVLASNIDGSAGGITPNYMTTVTLPKVNCAQCVLAAVTNQQWGGCYDISLSTSMPAVTVGAPMPVMTVPPTPTTTTTTTRAPTTTKATTTTTTTKATTTTTTTQAPAKANNAPTPAPTTTTAPSTTTTTPAPTPTTTTAASTTTSSTTPTTTTPTITTPTTAATTFIPTIPSLTSTMLITQFEMNPPDFEPNGQCTPGASGCGCGIGNGCNDDAATCVNNKCIVVGCQRGALGCGCALGGLCAAGSVCNAGVCTMPVGAASSCGVGGSPGCFCTANSQCSSSSLTCVGGVCQTAGASCNAGYAGCQCQFNGACVDQSSCFNMTMPGAGSAAYCLFTTQQLNVAPVGGDAGVVVLSVSTLLAALLARLMM